MRTRSIHIILYLILLPVVISAQNFKTGTNYKVIKGTTIELVVDSYRGYIQWQYSGNNLLWQNLNGENSPSLIFTIENPVYLRLSLKEGQCDWLYSDFANFIPIGIPEVITYEVANVSSDSIQYSGEILNAANGTITRKGVLFALTDPPTIGDSLIENTGNENFFWGTIRNLNANTTYYLRAFAENEAGIGFGNTITFNTTSGLAIVVTENADLIEQTSALLHGSISSDGGSDIDAKGLCWSLQPNPDLSDNHSDEGTGPGIFSTKISELEPGTKYYYRAFALNNAGIAYGLSLTFNTLGESPKVTTSSYSEKTDVSVRVYGIASTSEESDLIETGICWSKQANPDLNSEYLASNSPANNFNVRIQGLEPFSTYYFRAYAINEFGTGYGDQIQINTKASDYFTTTPSLTADTRSNFKGWLGIYPNYGSSTNGYSGVTYNWDTDEIYIVGNNAKAIWVVHAPGSEQWSDSSPGNSYIKTIPLVGYEDPEAITYLGNSWIMIADEALREVSFTKIMPQTSSINKSNSSVIIDPTKLFSTNTSANSFTRLEGLAYDFHNKIMYGLCEVGAYGHPRLFAWDWDFENQEIKTNTQREVSDLFPGLGDWSTASDLHYSALLKRLYIVSGEEDKMAEYYCPHPDEEGYGSLISTRQLPRSNGTSGSNLGDCEGICISKDGTKLFLCFENKSFGYAPLPFIRYLSDDNLPITLYPFQ